MIGKKPCYTTILIIVIVLLLAVFLFVRMNNRESYTNCAVRESMSGCGMKESFGDCGMKESFGSCGMKESFGSCGMKESFKVVGGDPSCPYRTDESCPYVKKGTGPACQIDKNKAGCPPCCGNIDWYLGPKEYEEKCGKGTPPAFPTLQDYYASIQENFMSEKNVY